MIYLIQIPPTIPDHTHPKAWGQFLFFLDFLMHAKKQNARLITSQDIEDKKFM